MLKLGENEDINFDLMKDDPSAGSVPQIDIDDLEQEEGEPDGPNVALNLAAEFRKAMEDKKRHEQVLNKDKLNQEQK
jgi:hypothetical protein